jgi:hypothetical protein
MNPLSPGPILPPEIVSHTSATLFSIIALTLSGVLFATVVLILFRHDSSVRPIKVQSRRDSFDEGETK